MKALAATIAVAVLAVVARPAPRPAVAPDRIPAAIAAYYGAPTPAIANLHRHDVCLLAAGRTDLAPAAATFVKEHCP